MTFIRKNNLWSNYKKNSIILKRNNLQYELTYDNIRFSIINRSQLYFFYLFFKIINKNLKIDSIMPIFE